MVLEYIINNNLCIDKGTYLSIVVGQITLYGILLTFYQFLIDILKAQKSEQYLGVNIEEFRIKNYLNIFHRTITSSAFLILFLLEILYKPLLSIFNGMVSVKIIPILNFMWYAFAVGYFIIFAIVIFMCARTTLRLKNLFVDSNVSVKSKIEKKVLKRLRVSFWKADANKLDMVLNAFYRIVQKDNNEELYDDYNRMLQNLFEEYELQKNKKLKFLNKFGKLYTNYAFLHNFSIECWVVEKLIKKAPFVITQQTLEFLFVYINNLTAFTVCGGKNEVNDISSLTSRDSYIVIDGDKIKNIIKLIYQKSEVELQTQCVNYIYTKSLSKNEVLHTLYEDCLNVLLIENIDLLFDGKLVEEDFGLIFSSVLKDENINLLYAKRLCVKYTERNPKSYSKILDLLSPINNNMILSFLILYYSIYKFRFDWEYVNIELLKKLYQNCMDFEEAKDDIYIRLKAFDAMHRLTKELYLSFIKSLHESIIEDWKKEDVNNSQGNIDAFYITIIKLCVLRNQYDRFEYYMLREQMMYFINELAKHEELLVEDVLRDTVYRISFQLREIESIPYELQINLRTLLLLDINLDIIMNEKLFMYGDAMGQYLLILSSKVNVSKKEIDDLIRMAYVNKNMSIDDFITYLEKESELCGRPINYVQKERMKRKLNALEEKYFSEV